MTSLDGDPIKPYRARMLRTGMMTTYSTETMKRKPIVGGSVVAMR